MPCNMLWHAIRPSIIMGCAIFPAPRRPLSPLPRVADELEDGMRTPLQAIIAPADQMEEDGEGQIVLHEDKKSVAAELTTTTSARPSLVPVASLTSLLCS